MRDKIKDILREESRFETVQDSFGFNSVYKDGEVDRLTELIYQATRLNKMKIFDQLEDTFYHHHKHCKSCRNIFNRIDRMRKGSVCCCGLFLDLAEALYKNQDELTKE